MKLRLGVWVIVLAGLMACTPKPQFATEQQLCWYGEEGKLESLRNYGRILRWEWPTPREGQDRYASNTRDQLWASISDDGKIHQIRINDTVDKRAEEIRRCIPKMVEIGGAEGNRRFLVTRPE